MSFIGVKRVVNLLTDNRFILTPQILKFIKTDLSKVMQVVNEK